MTAINAIQLLIGILITGLCILVIWNYRQATSTQRISFGANTTLLISLLLLAMFALGAFVMYALFVLAPQ